ncbi:MULTISPECIES: formyltransferase family protein [Haloarcula]|uniref:formyltransferase family protein n=1 Tax=Haloarcula TaxID=2237 RepID=UPI000F8CBFAE|nr:MULTISPECIES: formyltransferase family protein [Haloarcula]NHX41499.1 formyl transferase [Haloarcula sp. R1-2]
MRHEDSRFEEEVIGPWLASVSDLVGVVIIRNKCERTVARARRELHRSGVLGFADVLSFRLYYRIRLAEQESKKIDRLIESASAEYSAVPDDVPRITVDDPNDEPTKEFLREINPDAAVARIKLLLDADVFSIPNAGTYVIHPGICPEYRNAHGCFWALANGEPEKVGYTFLRIDEGIDTGPIIAQGGTEFDPSEDGHLYIQYKVVADNLDEIGGALKHAVESNCDSLDVTGRESDVWGQPRLSAYLRWKRQARRW